MYLALTRYLPSWQSIQGFRVSRLVALELRNYYTTFTLFFGIGDSEAYILS